MFLLVFLCVLSPATSFLIDVSTPNHPRAGTFITDHHYNALMDLFIEEKQSRQNLEKYVIQLNQWMTEMTKEVASTKIKVGVLEKTSSNVDLQEAFRALKTSSEIMKQSYDALLLEHSNLKREDNVVTQRHNQLQIDVGSLTQLKAIVPLQSLARKQKFIALMNVTISAIFQLYYGDQF